MKTLKDAPTEAINWVVQLGSGGTDLVSKYHDEDIQNKSVPLTAKVTSTSTSASTSTSLSSMVERIERRRRVPPTIVQRARAPAPAGYLCLPNRSNKNHYAGEACSKFHRTADSTCNLQFPKTPVLTNQLNWLFNQDPH